MLRLRVRTGAIGRSSPGRYIIGRRIGKGGFGMVYRCTDVEDVDAQLAVKVLTTERPNQDRATTLRKIEAEVETLREMQKCPRVVRLVDCFEDGDSVQVVMQLCAGGDLATVLDDSGPVGEATLARVAVQVLEVLRSCHASGIVYADVKPANLCLLAAPLQSGLLSPPFDIATVDFGCSGAAGNRMRGTTPFMAPEVFKGGLTFKSDLWSLGVTLYLLYTARLPFWDDTPLRLITTGMTLGRLHDSASSMPVLTARLAGLSPEGVDFILACLAKNCEDRPSADVALAHPWLRLDHGSG